MRLSALVVPFVLGASSMGGNGTGRTNDDPARRAPSQRVEADTIVHRADSLVRAGRPWRATALLASRLASPATATPEALIVGARAAAAWDGWTEVERLLRPAPWLDRQFGGEARELLARSALERNVDARADARLALEEAIGEGARATRLTLLARADERALVFDSAAANYQAAAAKLPRVRAWLQLRAAGVTGDSAARSAVFSHITTAIARARIVPTDAQAREGAADYEGAAQQYRRATMDGAAFRVEALAARDNAARDALGRRIVAYVSGTPRPSEVRQSMDVLDKLRPASAAEDLLVARAVSTLMASRAVAGFAHAAGDAPLSTSDRMAYAGALSRSGKYADAARLYASLSDAGALAPAAAYQHARALVQGGQGAAARTALHEVTAQYAALKDVDAPALLLLADLLTDDGDLAGAARALHDLIARHPSTSQAPLARFRLGLIQWTQAPAAAAATFDSLTSANPNSDEVAAARYWAARAYERIGRNSDADARWQQTIRATPLGYYGVLAAARTHTGAWTPPAGPDTSAHVAAVDSMAASIAILRDLGLDVEARFEIDALVAHAEQRPADGPAVAQALFAVGEPSRGLRVALVIIERGTATRAVFRNAYPILHCDALLEESRRNDLDPALVAGLIRQESSWNPRAISPASARGLMQLLPNVGASIAASHRYPLWNVALLLEPDVNLELGTAHLASSLKHDAPPARALAAYNAGGSRVTRWLQRPGTDDPELFTEWIPFTETRDYVRLVERNAAVYRALYGLQ